MNLPLVTAALLACSQPQSTSKFGFEAELSEAIPTVVTVTWTWDGDLDAAWVEFGRDAIDEHRAAVDVSAGSPYTTVVVGMKPTETYDLRVVLQAGDEQVNSETQTITTGEVSSSLPDISVEVFDDDAAVTGLFVTSIVDFPAAAVILDADGDYVWWVEIDAEVQVGRATLSRDRQAVLYTPINLAAGGGGGGGSGGPGEDRPPPEEDTAGVYRISLDGTSVEAFPITDAHHDAVELPDGGFAALAYDIRSDGEGELTGDKLVERSAGGEERDIYSIWDDFELSGSSDPWSNFSHGNAVNYDEEDDALLASFMGLNAILKVDRNTGERLWTLGGDTSDFATPQGSTDLFTNQHQFEVLEDSILIFDNGEDASTGSRAVEYSFDEDNPEVEEIWSYEPESSTYCFSFGDAHRRTDGSTLVNFSVAGQIDHVSAEGDLLWRLNTDLGAVLGYATWIGSIHP